LLDTQLKQLENLGIITKTIFNERQLKVEYALTPVGKTLIPVIEVTARWGEDHREELEPLFQPLT
jgi:DNA-binding HxlR family transcriptional regulator